MNRTNMVAGRFCTSIFLNWKNLITAPGLTSNPTIRTTALSPSIF